MSIWRVALALAFTTLIMPTAANAGFMCSGQVARLGGGNGLTIDIGSGVWSICSLETSLGGIDPRTCAAWYALLTSAKLTNKAVVLYFDTNLPENQGTSNCATLGNWTTRIPYFLELGPDPSLQSIGMPTPPKSR